MKPVIYIYNCKSCKTGKRVEYTEGNKRTGYGPRDATGKYISAGVWVTATGGGKPTEYDGDVESGICACGKMMSFGKLEGYVNPDVKCDARCTNARGHNCECSCGGLNHGSAW